MKLLTEFIEKELNIYDYNIIKIFLEYEKQILNWNKKINLISRKTASIENLILNSIFFIKDINFLEASKIIDIGTGGGIPGIPLKILRPDLSVTLLDSIQKKITAVKDIITKLKLENIDAVCGRAEALSKDEFYFQKYDYAVCKSVSTVFNIYRWSRNFIKTEGKVICIKGGSIIDDIESLEKNKLLFEVIEFKNYIKYSIEDKKIIIINTK